MTPIKFKQSNVTFAKDQDEYRSLPAHLDKDGVMTCCYKLTWKERFKILFGGKFWLQILTFNQPLQPLLPSADSPFQKENHV